MIKQAIWCMYEDTIFASTSTQQHLPQVVLLHKASLLCWHNYLICPGRSHHKSSQPQTARLHETSHMIQQK
jgi:hypothetical protein